MGLADRFISVVGTNKPYVFNYESEVEAFYAAFPARRRDLFFVDITRGMKADCLIGQGDSTQATWEFLRQLPEFIQDIEGARKKGSRAVDYDPIKCVFLYSDIHLKSPSSLAPVIGRDANACFILDHEIGHLMCDEGLSGGYNVSECIADTYAIFRHLQRFGWDTGAIEQAAYGRATELLIHLDGEHFSSPIAQRILADKDELHLEGKTLRQTMKLAHDYAVNHAPDVGLVWNMEQYLKKKKKPQPRLRDLANTVMSIGPNEAFGWGAFALHAMMGGHVNAAPRMSGKRTEALRAELSAREKATLRQSPTLGGHP